MDLHTASDLGFVKSEMERRYQVGRHQRKGTRPSHTIMLEAREHERTRLSGLMHRRAR